MAGGTDAHNGLTADEEDNFFAKFVSGEPRPDRWNEDAMKFGERVVKGWEMTAAGRTAVWATANTREALWDAMKRRETYATSGTNIGCASSAGSILQRATRHAQPRNRRLRERCADGR